MLDLLKETTIIVPSQERSSKGKLHYASIQIVFRSNDFPVVTLLCQVLGYGSISKKKQSAAYVYTINNLDGLIDIANLINGKMRGPEYNQYIKLIEYINKKSPNLDLVALPADQSSLGSNSWLTGFIEADGSFQVRASLQSKIKKRLGLSFELSQSRITHWCFPRGECEFYSRNSKQSTISSTYKYYSIKSKDTGLSNGVPTSRYKISRF